MRLLIGWLAACGSSSVGAPADTDDSAAIAAPAPSGTLIVEDVREDTCEYAEAAVDETLVAVFAGGDSVNVEHAGYATPCCLNHGVSATYAEWVVTVEYAPRGEPCDCTCNYGASYKLTPLPAGTYTVRAGGAETTVTVPD